jgi:endonuclease/exonuclease/phosphatase family metal-dependent hydrolase
MQATLAPATPAFSAATPPAAPALRVLTVNIHKGFSFFNRKSILPELRDAVRSISADIVFLQEVMGAHERHAKRVSGWQAAPHYEFLADTLWSAYAYGRNAVYPNGDHHGNAVLSKFPILSYQNHDVSIPPSQRSERERHERRGLLHCVIDVPGAPRGPLHAVCVHLGLAESHRQRQLGLLCELVHGAVPPGAALVVAGDFNDWRVRAHRALRACDGLVEVFREAQGRTARTFPARWPLLRLDRIYVRHVGRHRPLPLPARPWSHLSDHAPLAAELQL